ncbi:MAG: 30S ribosome-binding factor RbfA [Syntrophobacterales bacterium]|nr:MAG: 30S ribosome-binding factor RbfA [Syntrophobacterales bacterium]
MLEKGIDYRRPNKVGGVIKEELSRMLIREIKDPRIGFVTLTRVKVSKDLRSVKVYFSVFGDQSVREDSLRGLNSAKGFMRRELGRRLRLRYVPDIVFSFDPSLEYMSRLTEIIHQIHEDEKSEDAEGR